MQYIIYKKQTVHIVNSDDPKQDEGTMTKKKKGNMIKVNVDITIYTSIAIRWRLRRQLILMHRNKTGCPLFHLIGQFHSHLSVANCLMPITQKKWLKLARVNTFDMVLEPCFAFFSPLANVVPTHVPDVWWRKPRNFLWLHWEKKSN